jgi:hypothetical protein
LICTPLALAVTQVSRRRTRRSGLPSNLRTQRSCSRSFSSVTLTSNPAVVPCHPETGPQPTALYQTCIKPVTELVGYTHPGSTRGVSLPPRNGRSQIVYQRCINPLSTGLSAAVHPVLDGPAAPQITGTVQHRTTRGNIKKYPLNRLFSDLGAGGREFESPHPDGLDLV